MVLVYNVMDNGGSTDGSVNLRLTDLLKRFRLVDRYRFDQLNVSVWTSMIGYSARA